MNPGTKFGRLTVIKLVQTRGSTGKSVWRAETKCDCGKRKSIGVESLRSGDARSCGCLRRELAAERNHVHGASGTPLFQVWQHMHERVEVERYRELGVRVCDEWREYPVFHAYVEEHLGPKPAGYSIDRIDNARGYEPGNVRWASPVRQQRNKRNTRWVTAFGRTQCVHDWAEQYGVKPETIWARIHKQGMSPEEAISLPLKR